MDLVRYLNLADYYSPRIDKVDKFFTKKCSFKDRNFLVKIRDVQKIDKKIVSISFFFFSYENGEKTPNLRVKNVDILLLIEMEINFTMYLSKKFIKLIKGHIWGDIGTFWTNKW